MHTDQFTCLSLIQPILRALSEEGYLTPTPVQAAAIPEILAGRDLLATAQTGTGKTAAFSLPILDILHRRAIDGPHPIRALVLTPTRELALQIGESFRAYGRHLPLKTAVVLGGSPMGSQIKALNARPDILIATPGRLLDFHNQGHVRLDKVEMFVLDEADRMLDMGFIHDVRSIVSLLPEKRQTLFFSATLSPGVTGLASGMVKSPARVEVTPPATVADAIDQKVLFVEHADKRELLAGLLRDESVRRALVFARTKSQADRIARHLSRSGITVDVIHSNKTQNARQRALAAFDHGKVRVLVGTDIVARGIDVDGISHVINYELPNDPENYVHRIGRTARAGAAGTALSFCTADQLVMLRGIEKLTGSPIATFVDHPFHSASVAAIHDLRPFVRATPAPEFGRRRKAARPR